MKIGEGFGAPEHAPEDFEDRQGRMLAQSRTLFENLKERVAASPLGKALAGAAMLSSVQGCGRFLHQAGSAVDFDLFRQGSERGGRESGSADRVDGFEIGPKR